MMDAEQITFFTPLLFLVIPALLYFLIRLLQRMREDNNTENNDEVTEEDENMTEEDTDEVDIDELREKTVNEIDKEIKNIDPIVSKYLYAKWTFGNDDAKDILEDYYEKYYELKYGIETDSTEDTSDEDE